MLPFIIMIIFHVFDDGCVCMTIFSVSWLSNWLFPRENVLDRALTMKPKTIAIS